jgi:hypothetical protein
MVNDRGLRMMAGLCTATLAAAALSLAQPVLASVAFTLFVIAIAWPIQHGIQAHLPKGVALLVTMGSPDDLFKIVRSHVRFQGCWTRQRAHRFCRCWECFNCRPWQEAGLCDDG